MYPLILFGYVHLQAMPQKAPDDRTQYARRYAYLPEGLAGCDMQVLHCWASADPAQEESLTQHGQPAPEQDTSTS